MALDEPSDNDSVQNENGFDVIIDKNLLNKAGGISIDFSENGWLGPQFHINPSRTISGRC